MVGPYKLADARCIPDLHGYILEVEGKRIVEDEGAIERGRNCMGRSRSLFLWVGTRQHSHVAD